MVVVNIFKHVYVLSRITIKRWWVDALQLYLTTARAACLSIIPLLTMSSQFGHSHVQISLDPAPHGNSPAWTVRPGPPGTRNKHPGTGFGISPLISQASLIPVTKWSKDPRLVIPLQLRVNIITTKRWWVDILQLCLTTGTAQGSMPTHHYFAHNVISVWTQPWANVLWLPDTARNQFWIFCVWVVRTTEVGGNLPDCSVNNKTPPKHSYHSLKYKQTPGCGR